MSPPSVNSSPASDSIKAKITSLIQEQLKPIVTELAAQQQTLLNNLALLKHNHNVNDYQSTRLEGIRDLEQSVNYKVTGVLGFDPRQHPTMGTNLREPVPADPALAPKLGPVDRANQAERAAQSAELIKEAGLSARRLNVPLTFQDFPDHPSLNRSGKKKEDVMHASVPLFGLNDPRWRAKQGLDEHATPGTAAYDGVAVPPVGKKGLRLYNAHAKELKTPMWKIVEQGAHLGIHAASSSSSPGAATSDSTGVQGVPAGDNSGQIPDAVPPTAPSSSSLSKALSARPKPLHRTYAIANLRAPLSNPTSTPYIMSKPSAPLRRTATMAPVGSAKSTTSEASAHSSLSKISNTATIGSERPRPPSSSRTESGTTAKTKTQTKAKAKAKQSTSKQRSSTARTKTAAPTLRLMPTSTSSPSSTLKRGRQTAELEDTADDMKIDGNNQETNEEAAGPSSKRRKRSAADTGSESTTMTTENEGDGGQPRRSTRLTRASAASPEPRPAPRGRATKGKKVNGRP